MKRAAIYSRVDPKDRTVMPSHRAAAEEYCQSRGWSFVHYSDSASGNRPPLQFASGNQLIRPGLTRLLSAVESGTVQAVLPSDADAFSTNPDLVNKLHEFFQKHGFTRQEVQGDPGFCFVRE